MRSFGSPRLKVSAATRVLLVDHREMYDENERGAYHGAVHYLAVIRYGMVGYNDLFSRDK